MTGLDAIGLGTAQGVRLAQADYVKDFRLREFATEGEDSWKLERRQDFQQPGTPSWEAFARGEWGEALRLLEERREKLSAFAERNRRHGIELYRVRVVEEPIIPYVQWELYSLRISAEYGERIRIVGPDAVRHLEQEGSLPELINLGRDTLYEICYDQQGVADGAVRFTDAGLVERFRQLCRELYDVGEDLHTFFDRSVAQLPPPSVAVGRKSKSEL